MNLVDREFYNKLETFSDIGRAGILDVKYENGSKVIYKNPMQNFRMATVGVYLLLHVVALDIV